MTAAVSYFIAGISILTLLVFWFFNVYKILSRKRMDVQRAEDQVRIHREGFRQILGSPDEQAAEQMLEISRQIYTQIEMSYNATLGKPIYRFPGILMGFSRAESDWTEGEEKRMVYFCEDCGFVFCRSGNVKDCPYCGKKRIRSGTEEEDRQLRPFLERQNSDLGIKVE